MAISRKIRKKSSLISLQNLGEVEFPKKQAAASRGRKVWRIQVDKRLKFIQPQGLMGANFHDVLQSTQVIDNEGHVPLPCWKEG